ncbi:hypothetical protein HZA86_01700 [Candidatus Uhrbacteria bacterium]|nr:hypothetical protein [Candidatus Uhrbacteria bacterium]
MKNTILLGGRPATRTEVALFVVVLVAVGLTADIIAVNGVDAMMDRAVLGKGVWVPIGIGGYALLQHPRPGKSVTITDETTSVRLPSKGGGASFRFDPDFQDVVSDNHADDFNSAVRVRGCVLVKGRF